MTAHDAVAQYVKLRQAGGANFEATGRLLLTTFCRAVGGDLEIEDLPVDRVRAFLDGQGPITRYWHRKYSALRGFYRYAVSRQLVAKSPLPSMTPKVPTSFVPYVFTREEVRRLLDATSRYRKPPHRLEPGTFRALLLLLYGAGLRLGEALRLTPADFDRSAATLTIRDTKFYKTRVVPLGPDLQRALLRHVEQRKPAWTWEAADTTLFADSKSAPLRARMVQRAFADLRTYAGIRRTDGARYQPRLHDLRGSFAVDRLTAWYREGANVQQLLPQLSTYLGHLTVAATQVYLTMTPELLGEACGRFERYAAEETRHER